MNLDYNSIKRKIESESCNEHHQKAVFTKTVKGFTIKACCKNFEKTIAKKAEQIVAQETKKVLEASLKKMFK